MTWQAFYLATFGVGFLLAVFAFLSGAFHWGVDDLLHHLHLPTFGGAHAPGLHLPAGHVGGAHGGPHAAPHVGSSRGALAAALDIEATTVSPWNFGTLMAFLAWFGGVGYLLTSEARWAPLAVLVCASLSGAVGGAIVFGFLTRVLLKHERFLQSADFRMSGVLAQVTVPIREGGGTGEIVYSQAGTRRSAGARSESGAAIARGSEVVVTRYDRGIAYVRPFAELLAEDDPAPATAREHPHTM